MAIEKSYRYHPRPVPPEPPTPWFLAEPTPATMAIYTAEVDRWRAMYPEKFDAPQPLPLPRVEGRHHLDPQAEWGPFVESGQFVRDPPESTEGMIRLTAFGYCLSPVLQQDDAFWLDTRAVPEDGDLISVQVSPRQHARYLALAEQKPEFRTTYGSGGMAVVIKRLRAMGGDWYCCTNSSAFPLDDGRVLGVVRAIEKGQGGAPGVGGSASCTALPLTSVVLIEHAAHRLT